jgi:hypothetical protein
MILSLDLKKVSVRPVVSLHDSRIDTGVTPVLDMTYSS